MRVDDETLMAFADGELDRDEAEAVASAVAADPDLAAKVEMFRATRAALAGSAPPAARHDDSALIARIRAAQVAPVAPALTATAPQPANRNWRPAAIAASVAAAAVMIVYATGMFGPATGPAPAGGVLPPALTAALEAIPSGEGTLLADGEFTAIASYRLPDGAICREYERHGAAQTAIVAVACREADGWRDRFATEFGQSPDGYVTASAEIEGLDAALEQMEAGLPLDPAEETEALRALRQ